MNKSWVIFVFAVLAISVTSMSRTAFAEGVTHPKLHKQFSERQLAQQQRMKDCNVESKETALTGSDHRAFMKTCLSGGQVVVEVGNTTASAPNDIRTMHKQKAQSCRAAAKMQSFNRDTRKRFMRECLAK